MAVYIATALVVKVSIGSATGHRVAQIVRQGGIVPAGVAQEQLDRLEQRGLIQKVIEDEPAVVVVTEAEVPTPAWNHDQINAWAAQQDPPVVFESDATKAQKLEVAAAAIAQRTGS